jgi:hypothetical protein
MKPGLALGSLFLLGLSILFLAGLTVFESALVGRAPGTERLVTLSLLVLPAVIGAVLGVLSLVRREGRAGLAITGIALNTFFALFHLMLVLFAG